jgi:hypothetical protein
LIAGNAEFAQNPLNLEVMSGKPLEMEGSLNEIAWLRLKIKVYCLADILKFGHVDLSAKGAPCKSLGQRPRDRCREEIRLALKARNGSFYFAPSELNVLGGVDPGPLAQAIA